MSSKVTVIDSIMGSGKTSWAIRYMNESPASKRFIYVTPYLNEVTRISDSVTSRQFYEPDNRNKDGRKLSSFKSLIAEARDIATTHSLFGTVDDKVIELLTGAGYTLILDEALEVVGSAPIGPQDFEAALQAFAKVEDKRVIWTAEKYVDTRFQDIKRLAKTGSLYYHRDHFLIWTFPPDVFRAFDNVFVMTYLFDAQLQRYYFDMHGISYNYRAVKVVDGKYELCAYSRHEEGRQEIMKRIELYDGKLNEVGEEKTAFSVRWMDKTNRDLSPVKKNVYNYLRNICDANGSEIMWTTKKDYEQKLKGRGFAKSFVACNLRATNEHADKWALAYVFNRFMNPYEKSFFQDHEIKVNEDLLAVSDLLQWIWRSRIRNGESIKLYLPSSRMRSLLQAWSKYEL